MRATCTSQLVSGAGATPKRSTAAPTSLPPDTTRSASATACSRPSTFHSGMIRWSHPELGTPRGPGFESRTFILDSPPEHRYTHHPARAAGRVRSSRHQSVTVRATPSTGHLRARRSLRSIVPVPCASPTRRSGTLRAVFEGDVMGHLSSTPRCRSALARALA
jgi:hypothetical protein